MTKITYIKNGPAIVSVEDVKEGVLVQLPTGFEERIYKPVAICRCGKSDNGYTCDGSHVKKK